MLQSGLPRLCAREESWRRARRREQGNSCEWVKKELKREFKFVLVLARARRTVSFFLFLLECIDVHLRLYANSPSRADTLCLHVFCVCVRDVDVVPGPQSNQI
jgi:hypothetical protein